MKAAAVVAEILKREGVRCLIGYPVNNIIEAAAEIDIRTIIVRQERVGLHMCDAMSRVTSGDSIGVFANQHGPGTENSFGGVAQAYGDSVPIVVLPGGYPRRLLNIPPNFSSFLNYQHITKWAEQAIVPETVPDAMRRAFTQVRNGRPRPVLVEIPVDVLQAEVPDGWSYTPAPRLRVAPEPRAVAEVAAALVAAERPVIYAGQGVHYAKAWKPLRELAELLEAPVTTSLQGKSAFPETHPLSLGSGGRSISKQLHHFLNHADLIFGIGCSFSTTNYGVAMPKGKRIVHATLDPADINKDVPAALALVGDAGLTLEALVAEVRDRLKGRPRGRAAAVTQEIKRLKSEWLAQWMPRLTSKATPLSPYRVLWDLMHTVDVANTIITHDAGSPRDQISPFWEPVAPLTYIGWGKTTQLGPGWATPWAPSWPRPTSSASTCGATPPSASPAWTSRRRSASGPHPLGAAQQLLDGHRAQGDEGGDREVPLDGYQRALCGLRPCPGRLGRAGDRAGRDRPGHQAGRGEDAGGHAGLAGVHHREGDRLLDLPAPPGTPDPADRRLAEA